MTESSDFSTVRAKVLRAREHLDTLHEKILAITQNRVLFTISTGEVDQETGWVEFYIEMHDDFAEDHLGVYVGDVVHNLRCALNYAVILLVPEGVTPPKKLQFPIYHSSDDWENHFGTLDSPKKGNRLKCLPPDVFETIRTLQPCYADGEYINNPLWFIEEFSNADKHREIAAAAITGGRFFPNIRYREGREPIEVEDLPAPPGRKPNMKWVFRRARFAPGPPIHIDCEPQAAADIRFGVRPRAWENDTFLGLRFHDLSNCCDHVSMVLDTLEAL